MIEEALGSGLRMVGGALGCARGLVQRLGAQLVQPIVGLATLSLVRATPDEPAPDATPPRETGGPQAVVEEAKYYLGPPRDGEARPTVDRETGELPRAYGRDRIVLLPRDPWWAFAYWEVTPTTRVRALRALGPEAEGAREIVRVYDVTFITFTGDNAWLSFDVEVTPGTDHWYLNVGRPAASFCAEIGLRTAGGRFLPLARSNVITTARSAPSSDATLRWVGLRPGATSDAPPPWAAGRPPGNGLDLLVPDDSPSDGRPRSSDRHAPTSR